MKTPLGWGDHDASVEIDRTRSAWKQTMVFAETFCCIRYLSAQECISRKTDCDGCELERVVLAHVMQPNGNDPLLLRFPS